MIIINGGGGDDGCGGNGGIGDSVGNNDVAVIGHDTGCDERKKGVSE